MILASDLQAQSRYAWKESQTEVSGKTVNNPKANNGIEVLVL